jgi:hypothetical protein
MRTVPLLFLTLVAACASTADAPFPAAQKVLDGVAQQHKDLVRLTLHAVPQGKTQCTQLASTVSGRVGKPSDPEDLEAMRTGREVVLEEQGAVDVTVPIIGNTAVAGVTLRSSAGASRDAVVQQARAIAEELAAAVMAAGKPLW